MLFEIKEKKMLADGIFEMKVDAPRIAAHVQAGQFLILRTSDKGERIPLTFSDWNADEGWIKFIFMTVGKSTRELSTLCVGDHLQDLVGPLGEPTKIEKGKWIVVGGGVGTSVAYPVARALCEAGAEVRVIVGARTSELLLLQKELDSIGLADLIIATDDGTAGERGLVTAPLSRLCDPQSDEYIDPDHVFVVGPAVMMKFAALATREFGTDTIASLNPLMIDGTGMCGACRCTVGGKLKFGCVDGPDFDAHEVDWEELMNRQRMYQEEEKDADAAYIQKGGSCQG